MVVALTITSGYVPLCLDGNGLTDFHLADLLCWEHNRWKYNGWAAVRFHNLHPACIMFLCVIIHSFCKSDMQCTSASFLWTTCNQTAAQPLFVHAFCLPIHSMCTTVRGFPEAWDLRASCLSGISVHVHLLISSGLITPQPAQLH